jgi:hypothetical protein
MIVMLLVVWITDELIYAMPIGPIKMLFAVFTAAVRFAWAVFIFNSRSLLVPSLTSGAASLTRFLA